MKQVRIALIEDHEMVRQGLIMLIKHSGRNYEVVGESGSAAGAGAMVAECLPDVILLDLKLPDGSGIDVCRQIKEEFPEKKIIVLTSYADKDDVYQAIAAGASGYVLKQTDSTVLLDAIDKASRGEALFDPVTVTKLVEYIQTNTNPSFRDLTDREVGILLLLAEGKSNREIAGEICLTEKTVRNYVSTILSKLQVSNRAEAAVMASKNMEYLKRKGIQVN